MPIVEGQSEAESIPVLLRRYLVGAGLHSAEMVAKPIRVKRNLVVKGGQLERAIELATRLYPNALAVLVVLDADQDCPARLGPELLARAQFVAGRRFQCAVVLPKTEVESWFIASVESLRGQRGISADAVPPRDPEGIRDAKGWLSDQMQAKKYIEVDDQPAFAEEFDLSTALKCRSFRKFDKEVKEILSKLA